MTEKEILQHIDEGANFYIQLFGHAEHMEIIEREFFRYVKPKTDVHGISFVFDIRPDGLPIGRIKEIVSEIKALNMPFWLNLTSPDETFRLFFGKDRIHGQTLFHEEDEVYMAMLPSQNTLDRADKNTIVRVQTPEEFAVWAKISNDILSGGLPDIHPVFHYPLCREKMMKCYTLYVGNEPVAVCAILDNHGIASLEFVAVLPEMRRKGYAKAVCKKAVGDAFADGAKIVTVRAINPAVSLLYHSLGFTVYNYAI